VAGRGRGPIRPGREDDVTLWVPITLSHPLTWSLALDEGRSG
jgi:hypothetical protein